MRSTSCRRTTEPVRVDRLGLIDYVAAWDVQRANAEARRAGGPDVLMLLEHPSVYTAGRRTQPADRPTDGTPVVEVDRGGRITWHGPGQLVGYPIVALSEPFDVVDFVRRLEEAMIAMVRSFGLTAVGRVKGRTGVWLPADATRPERKLGAIGVRVQAGVTLHGFALNCNPDLTEFDRIVPCGLTDVGVSSLSAELGRDVPVDEVIDAAEKAVLDALDGALQVMPHDIPRAEAPAGLDLQLHPALR